MRYSFSNAFQKILKESDRKLGKTWVNKGSEFYTRSIKSSLEKKLQTNVFNP